jgi:hypothetical protein
MIVSRWLRLGDLSTSTTYSLVSELDGWMTWDVRARVRVCSRARVCVRARVRVGGLVCVRLRCRKFLA